MQDINFSISRMVNLQMNWVEPGSFSRNGFRVTISKGFWLGKFLFTRDQWQEVMESKNKKNGFSENSLPVDKVDWFEAMNCCQKLNELLKDQLPDGYRFSLPTEAQWEFAARGGIASKGYCFSGGNTLGDVAWYQNNSNGKLQPVGQKLPNELNFFDMSGNAAEWCSDWYDDYPYYDVTDPTGAEDGSRRVTRGGRWSSPPDYDYCACDSRSSKNPENKDAFLGFRVALVPRRGK